MQCDSDELSAIVEAGLTAKYDLIRLATYISALAGHTLAIAKHDTDLERCRTEFFRVVGDPAAYARK